MTKTRSSREGRTTYRHHAVSPPRYSSRIKAIVDDIKKKHRSDMRIDAWTNEGFAGSDICDMPLLDESLGRIKRELCKDLSVERFIEEYERPAIPVVIDGIPEDEHWPACHSWTFKVRRRIIIIIIMNISSRSP
jgi:hypothetical protein